MRYRKSIHLRWLAASAAVFAATQITYAQVEFDEVVVTTGFRQEPLTESVGSVAVIDSGIIEVRAAEHLETVLTSAANVTLTSGSSRSRFVQIRGVGDLEQFVDPKHFPSVGVSFDGIDLGGLVSAAMLFDVEQIDVLRGPQGTAFGASALAGQIDIRSRAPADTFDAHLDAGLGDYGTASFGFAAGGALAQGLSGRIALQRNRSDGYIDNAWLGRDDTNGREESTLRARLRFSPSDRSEVDVTGLRFESDNGYDAFSLDNTRVTLSDEPGRDDLDLTAIGVVARIGLDSGAAIEARTSWLDSETDYGFDEDWTFVGICDGTLCDPVFDFFSNADRYQRRRTDRALDVRWLGEAGSRRARPVRYVIGVYAQDRDESLDRQYYGPFASSYASSRVAVYGQVQAGLSERLELTVGYRRERFDDDYRDSNAFASASDDSISSGEMALGIEVTERVSMYATLARGNKPGGVNTEGSSVRPFVQPRFQDFLDSRLVIRRESLTSLELGVKTRLARQRLGMRAALFRMERDDAQLESWFWDPVNFLWVGVLDNADGSNTGAELELDFAVTGNWMLRASLGVLDTEVDSLTTFDLDLDNFVVRDGIEQAKAPSWTAYLGSEWLIGSDWRIAVDLDASDAHRFGYYHDATIPGATRFNASLTRTIGATELALWARNLLDEDYAVHGLYFGNDPRKGWVPESYRQPGEPRVVGLSLRHVF